MLVEPLLRQLDVRSQSSAPAEHADGLPSRFVAVDSFFRRYRRKHYVGGKHYRIMKPDGERPCTTGFGGPS
jgi:hypothetical protein